MGSRTPNDLPRDIDDLDQRLGNIERLNFVGARRLVGGTGEPSFTNSWTNFGGGESVANFYKEGSRVYVGGLIKSGTINASAFTLPVGYRPGGACRFAGVSNGVFAYLAVESNGNVTVSSGSNVYADLSPIQFDARP